MPLVLQPTLSDLDREQVEQFIAAKRAKRMVATIEYHQSKNAKVIAKQSHLGQRIAKQVELLGNAIIAMERAEERVEEKLAAIEQLKHEYEERGEDIVELEE